MSYKHYEQQKPSKTYIVAKWTEFLIILIALIGMLFVFSVAMYWIDI